jgi:hypothetical protein
VSLSPSLEAPSPTPAPVVLNPAAPLTKAYTTTTFKPKLTLRLPAGWTAAERDEGAFQVYLGDNEEYELTFDHGDQTKQTPAKLIDHLRATPGLHAGPVTPVIVGGHHGLAFVGTSTDSVSFDPSGYRTLAAGQIEVMAVPVGDGTSMTLFVDTGQDAARPLPPMSRLVRRILATVTWH